MGQNIEIKQHDITDCGAACLSSVAAFYDLHLSMARIRQIAHTDRQGTNFFGMVEAARKLGFAAKGVKAIETIDGKPVVKTKSLHKISLPAIVHLLVDEKLLHFVVIYRINKTKIWIMDPATGELKAQPEFPSKSYRSSYTSLYCIYRL